MSTLRLPHGLAPLRHRRFRLLFGGQLASNVGDAFYAVALPWYVLANHGGVLLLGTVLAAYGIPRTVLVAVGGHAADRWRPWTVMMAADAIRAVTVAVLAVVAITGPAQPEMLVPIAAVIGAGEGIFLPGSFSIVPSLVPAEHLQAGNSLTSSGTQVATLVGPAIGGAVVAIVGAPAAFAIDAVSFTISAASLAMIRTAPAPAPDMNGTPASSADAAACASKSDPSPATVRQVLRTDRALQVILLIAVAANFGAGGSTEVALPALARDGFHAGAAGYGGLIAAFGAGGLLGTLVSAQVRQPRRPALFVSAAYLIEAGFLAVVPYLGGPIPAGIALAGFGACSGFGNVVVITAFQRWAPPRLLGRLMGLLLLAVFSIFPVSVLLGGFIVHSLGAAPYFPLAAAVLVLAIAGGLTQPAWRTFAATDLPGPAVPR